MKLKETFSIGQVSGCSGGAGLGGLTRYAPGTWIITNSGVQFPPAPFFVSISGAFLIGLLMAILTGSMQPHPNWRLFLVVGCLGGQPIPFLAAIEVPPQTGRVVAAEWDFVGDGTFAVAGDVTGSSGTRVVLKATHAFPKPGTCFPVLRAASQLQGEAKSPYARNQNLGRVRLIVG